MLTHDAINVDDSSTNPNDLDAYAETLERLADYAHAKARAMRLRLSGEIGAAVNCEARCDAIYRRLPEWAKW